MGSETWFTAPGKLIDAPKFVLPKSRQLAEFLLSGVHRNARFLEARATAGVEKFETIVLEVDVEVGQAPLRDIRPVERIAVSFSESDRSWPEVLALRFDFPDDLPHLFPRLESAPCSLCLYEESYEEVRLRWTAVKIVERIRFWLRESSRSNLHGSDQPLEPVFVGRFESLILPANIFSASANAPEHLSVQCCEQGFHSNVYIATRIQGNLNANLGGFVATVFLGAPRVQRAIQLAPRNLLELGEAASSAGVDVIDGLRRRLMEWQHDPPLLNSRLILVVAFPKIRGDGAPVEASDIWAFGTNQSVMQLGEMLSLWQLVGGSQVGGLVGVNFDIKRAAGIGLAPLNPQFALVRSGAAAANGVVPDAKRITAVGVGALGSQVIGTLVRGGYGQWKFIDEDMFLPHNAARHELPHSAVGRTKVTALTQWVNSLLAEPVAEAGVVANLLDPGDQCEPVENALRGAEVIADFSASQAVARYLARDFDGPARCVSAFMNPSGTDLVVLAEDASRQTRLDAVEMQYYRMLLEESALSEHFQPPEGQVRTARSCRDVSAVLAGDIVSHHASVASRGFRMALSQDDARIYIWRTDQQFNTRLFQRSPARMIERAVGNARVITDELFLSAVRQERQRKLPRETGGVLLGTWDLQRGIVYVVAMIPSPDDSEERPTTYIRGCQGLESAVSRGVAESGGQLQYIGEWHSHPDGHSANPSEDDCKLFNWVREYTTQDGYPPVMLIVGEKESRWIVGGSDDNPIVSPVAS
jgi:integrative and conjugative element protein (TIGR02256 family)